MSMTPVYFWKLGDIALGRICKKIYAKVQVVKNEDGIFFDDKGISPDGEDIKVTEILCYYVEILRTRQRLWLPYTSMFLAARSRPFYGTERIIKKEEDNTEDIIPKQRRQVEDHTLPIPVKPLNQKEPDTNTSFEITQRPLKQEKMKLESTYKEYIRRGKEKIFDDLYSDLLNNNEQDILEYLHTVDASTEDQFETVLRNVVTEKEVEEYLHQCWRFNYVYKRELGPTESPTESPVHTTWCLVCGGSEGLEECCNCPSAFHEACWREWLVSIVHRKKFQREEKPPTLVERILSSTRMKCSVEKKDENVDFCPSCKWGPRAGYDDVVWHKMSGCPWWPARVLSPGRTPSCLLTLSHSPNQWPLKYYGTLNHTWADVTQISLFLPTHTLHVETSDDMLKQAMLDACDDYISVYLT